ncbi:MAG: hypothetical protein KF847_02000 [Pirellulales bacterium]|nr:hypothetical protein [Pirellulales bacterium]
MTSVLPRAAARLSTCGLLAAAFLTGCSSRPGAIDVPRFDPGAISAKAMELYDKDKDGFIAGSELLSAPGLNAAMKTIDTNGDQKIEVGEIAERVRMWGQMQIGLLSFQCSATLDGTPLVGAKVTFEPEEFMLGTIQAAEADLGALGVSSPTIPKEKRPSPDTPPGVQAGIYKVRISRIQDGKETIPAKYNTETILGQQVSKDDPGIMARRVNYALSSK